MTINLNDSSLSSLLTILVLDADLSASLPGSYSWSVVIVSVPENKLSQIFVTNPLLVCCLVSPRERLKLMDPTTLPVD